MKWVIIMSRLMRLILIVLSLYMIVFVFLFIGFDIQHTMLDGTMVILYLIVFVGSLIVLTFVFDRDISKYIAIPLYFTIVIGFRAFYSIFIYIDDLPINSEPKYGFEYYIYHTFFSESTFHTYKITEAQVFIGMVFATIVITMGVYLKKQKGTMKDNDLSE